MIPLNFMIFSRFLLHHHEADSFFVCEISQRLLDCLVSVQMMKLNDFPNFEAKFSLTQ